MHCQLEMISPAQAKEYLERSIPNRRINDGTVTRYADDMREGRWSNNGQPIIFNEAGELLDGQHRLRAVIVSGRTVAFMVTRGVPTVAMETMDTNRPRSLNDVLTLKGYKNTANIAGAARLVWNYAAGVNLTYTASKSALLKFIEGHPKFVLDASPWVEKYKQNLFPRSPITAVLALATESAQLNEEAKKFADGVLYGEGLYKGDARFTLRRWMEQLRARHEYSGSSVSVPTFGATARAWTAYAKGETLEYIRFPPSPSRENTKVFGFNEKDWPEVPDLRARLEEARLANLARARSTSGADRDKAKALAADRAQVVRELQPDLLP